MYSPHRSSSGAVPSSSTPKGPADDSETINSTILNHEATDTEVALPEGGTAAWCAVFGAFLAQFCGFGCANSFGVFQAFYSQQYLPNQSSSSISWIGSVVSFLGPGIGLVCGPLFDRGYFYHLWIGGAVLQSFSTFMLSLVKPGYYYQILLAQGVAFGIGLGLMYIPSFAVLSHYFKRRRPVMMSVVTSGAALGGIAYTIMLNKLLNGPVGFQKGVRISAGFTTALLLLCCILVHPRYDALQQKAAANVSFWNVAKKCYKEMPTLFTIVGFTFYQTAFTYPFFYLQIESIRRGLPASFAFYTVVIISAGSFFGRVLPGVVLPFIGIVDLTILATFSCAVLIISMIWIDSIASVVVIALLYGMFSGINSGMLAPMLGLTCDRAELGARLGIGIAIIGIGNLVGSPICGALLTREYIWWRSSLFSGAIALVGSVFLVVVRFLLARDTIGGGKCPSGDSERPCDEKITTGNDEEEEKKADGRAPPGVDEP